MQPVQDAADKVVDLHQLGLLGGVRQDQLQLVDHVHQQAVQDLHEPVHVLRELQLLVGNQLLLLVDLDELVIHEVHIRTSNHFNSNISTYYVR